MIDDNVASIHNVEGAFSNADESVINWKGDNFYRSCDALVMEMPDGGATYCVKRADHPGDIHEDYDGVRKTDEKGRMVVAVTFPLNPDERVGFAESQRILQTLKPHFQRQKDVLVYGAVREVADQIIMILEGDG